MGLGFAMSEEIVLDGQGRMRTQPFLTYTTKKQTTLKLNTETTYDWENRQWTVPVNLMVAQLVKIGNLPVQFEVGGRYYAERADNGPEWGLRCGVTFLFPK